MNGNIRLDHIDVLKGFTILLVVMGHFLQHNIENIVCNGTTEHALWFIYDVIYSFHMPLFFFLSAYLFIALEQQPLPKHFIGQTIAKKAVSLMLPWLSNLLIIYLIFRFYLTLWFLTSLFWIFVVFVPIHYFAKRSSMEVWKEVILHTFAFVLLFVATHFITKTRIDTVFTFHRAMKLYPYFIMGYAFYYFERICDKKYNNLIFTIAALLYGLLFYLEHYAINDSHQLLAYPIVLCAIMIVYISFTYPHTPTTTDSFIYRQLAQFGKQSLTIYLFGNFFLIISPYIGKLLLASASWDSSYLTCITLQIVLPILPSLVAIYCLMTIQNIFQHSKLLNLILFGKRWW